MVEKSKIQNSNIFLTEHFALSEVICRKNMQICPYCGGELPSYKDWDRMIKTLRILEIVREHFQDPFAYVLLTSAHRCKRHNNEVSTCENPDLSQHRIFAVDCRVIQQILNNKKRNVPAIEIYNLLNSLISTSIGGIGIIDDIGVHFDLREENPWRRDRKY